MIPENEISKIIVDAAIEVHRELGGPGLVEEVYEEALEEELRIRALRVDRQLPVRIVYKGRVLRKPLRLDMKVQVQGLILVENKAVVDWNPIHAAQMLTYLRLTGLRLGLVINFGERVLKAGIHRVVKGLPEEVDFFNAKTPFSRGAACSEKPLCASWSPAPLSSMTWQKPRRKRRKFCTRPPPLARMANNAGNLVHWVVRWP